tara:strand:+ start:287 stop:478 length:192 start_codon:yes stop_codon:yes gene_type:complete
MAKKQKKEDLTPLDRIPGLRHTKSQRPPYDPEGHVKRRDKDEEKLKALLSDLIKTEISKLFKK